MIGQIFYVGALEALAPGASESHPSLLRELVKKELVRRVSPTSSTRRV